MEEKLKQDQIKFFIPRTKMLAKFEKNEESNWDAKLINSFTKKEMTIAKNLSPEISLEVIRTLINREEIFEKTDFQSMLKQLKEKIKKIKK